MKELIFIIIYLAIADTIFFKSINKFLNNQIRIVQNKQLKLNMYSALAAYLLIAVGLYYFGIVKKFTILEMFFLGIFTYGIYELTNHAIFSDWKLEMVLIDTVWGGILFSSCIYFIRLIYSLKLRN